MADPAHSSPTAAAAGDSLLAPDAPAEAVLPAAAAPDLDAEFGFQRPELGKEKLAGTVGFHQRHVFLCYKGPEEWPSHVEATDSDRLPRLLAAAIKARKSNLKKSTKLTICEGEDGTESSLGDVLIFPDMIRYRGLTHFDVDNFVEEVLVKDVEWLPGSPEAIRGSYVFVCVHGSRDKRCGVCGPALITRFKEIEGQGLDGQVAVSACSHVGGHKYAGNVIIFSSDAKGEVTGHWYGYVAPDDVPVLLHKHIGQGEIVDHLWRGQFGIIEEQQKEDCNPAPAGGCCQSSGGGFTCCQSDLPEEKQDKSVPAEKHKRYKSISQNRTVVGSSKDLLGKDDDALFRKREWKELATKFLDVYYKTLKESPELLHHLYSENCDVNWVLEESYQMRTPQEVQDRISSLIKSQQNSNFWKKKHHIQKNGKTIHVVAHGIFKAEKNCNFVQSFVLHRQTGAICNDVLLVLANAKSVNFTVERSSIVAATEERNEDVEAGPSYTNLEATEMGKREVMLVYNEQCLDHVPLGPHVEHPTRISLIMDRLQKDGVLGRVLRTGSRPAFKEELLAVHSERHISIIDNFPLTAKELQLCAYISNINDMYTSSGTKTAVYLAAGAVIKACEAVVKGDVKRAFALVRPPGHHASAEFSEGFCFVNNAAIAARYVLNLLENVMLVDIDVHHGNGSQRVFYDSDSVLVFSTHRSDMGYPSAASKEKILSPVHTSLGDGNGKGFNVNVPMKKGFGDSEILLAIDEILAPLVKAFNPGLILVSAGFDAADGDALGGCKVSSKCFGTITKKLMEMGNGKLVMCLEGGYGSALPGCVSHCIRALLGDTDVCLSEEEIRCLPAPSQDAIDTVRKLKKLLNKVWNIFSK